MDKGADILVSAIKALSASITSPYPYYGLLGVLEYFALGLILKKSAATGWDFGAFLLVTAFLVSIALLVFRLIETVGHEKMLSSEVLIKLAEIDAKVKLSEQNNEGSHE